ncbi:TIR domain-containing protein [Chelativorans sp. YIM 93263]|uniref:TIR domain-containing protein n=1 Tax=Chelativorans sp. YIM 93263 TaxID=2906648 RepID=UPI00237974B7|nr:TIR domain-containing protein [Chelativorans sp. YIM 93263]
MTQISVFISYSHADEWLKDELVSHLAALRRKGDIDVWHDRLIPPGGMLDTHIDEKVRSAQIFLFLISPKFIQSDYCMHREYEIARQRHEKGEAEIVPVLIRACDWDVAGLKNFNALPPDAIPVTNGATRKDEDSQRDAAWVQVIDGLKTVIANLKKSLTPPSLSESYLSSLFCIDFIRHPNAQLFDERDIFVDPEIYHENEKEQIGEFATFVSSIEEQRAVIITGGDRSGKSLFAKKLQAFLDSKKRPTVLISGKELKNAHIERYISRAIEEQYGLSGFLRTGFAVILDDFDECRLPDRIKEKIVKCLSEKYKSVIIFSFSNAPSVLFTPDDLPDPQVYSILPFGDEKLFSLVKKWKCIGLETDVLADDRDILVTHEKLQLIFEHSEIEKSPYSAVTFLELIESISGGDLTVSSFASCYDTLITNRLKNKGTDWRSFDEAKNFLSLLAYRAFRDNGTGTLSREAFRESLETFSQQFLSDVDALKEAATPVFIDDNNGDFSFREEYLWYFLCARYVAKVLLKNDREKYTDFIDTCTDNIFQKKYANVIIFIAYFSDDNYVISSLTRTLDSLFSKADDWILSDRSRELMLGIPTQEQLAIESRADIVDNRVAVIREKITDIIRGAEDVVAKYTLPFLVSSIDDSELVEEIDQKDLDADSYMRSVNALLRIHSVLGQILTTRSGTYNADLVLACISKMVQASGRYAYLNHAIATVLIYDADGHAAEVDRAIDSDIPLEEKFEKVQRIFGFWSVYLSQAGLARYLAQDHSIRALERLAANFEGEASDDHYLPFNFTSVLIIARFYHQGRVNRRDIESCIKNYGSDSAIMQLLRVAFHIYSYYMPLAIEDKQWISTKLNMPLKQIEAQRYRSSTLGREILKHAKGSRK